MVREEYKFGNKYPKTLQDDTFTERRLLLYSDKKVECYRKSPLCTFPKKKLNLHVPNYRWTGSSISTFKKKEAQTRAALDFGRFKVSKGNIKELKKHKKDSNNVSFYQKRKWRTSLSAKPQLSKIPLLTHIEKAFVSPIDAEIVELTKTDWSNQLPDIQKVESRHVRVRKVIRLKYY